MEFLAFHVSFPVASNTSQFFQLQLLAGIVVTKCPYVSLTLPGVFTCIDATVLSRTAVSPDRHLIQLSRKNVKCQHVILATELTAYIGLKGMDVWCLHERFCHAFIKAKPTYFFAHLRRQIEKESLRWILGKKNKKIKKNKHLKAARDICAPLT